MTSVFFDPALNDEERRDRLYAGDIILFSATPASLSLVELARRLLEEAFAPHDPRTIHRHRTPEEVAAILARLKPCFIHHPDCKELIPALMRERGIDPEKLYFDVPRLRSAYPSEFLASGIAYAFHPHRDTWYSAPPCQLNWWIPIYPLQPDNAMAFYPRYFAEPVRNNSEIYNYYDWNSRNRATAAQHVRSDTREQPKPQQPLQSLSGPALRRQHRAGRQGAVVRRPPAARGSDGIERLLSSVRPEPTSSDSLDQLIRFDWRRVLRPKARLPSVSHGPRLLVAKRVERQQEGQGSG